MAARPALKLKPLPPLLPTHSNPRRVHPVPPDAATSPAAAVAPLSHVAVAQDSAVEIGDLKRRRHDLTMESSQNVLRMSVLQQDCEEEQERPRSCFHLDDDTKQELQAKFGLYLNGFMNVMGCLLVIFVPQKCEVGNAQTHPVRLKLNVSGLCEFEENIDVHYLDDFNIAVLLLNFWTLFCVLFHSYLLQKREAFLIEAFDVDPMLPSDALELFVKDSAGQAQRSWLLQCAEQQRFFAGMWNMSRGFVDILKDDAPAAAGDAVIVGNAWEHAHFRGGDMYGSYNGGSGVSSTLTKQAAVDNQLNKRDADEIKERLQALACANHVCLTWLKITGGSHFLNLVLSAVLIWYFYSLDYRSYTVLLTNVVAVTKMLMAHMTVLANARHAQTVLAEDGKQVRVSICSASLVQAGQLFFNRLDRTESRGCCA